MNIDLKNLTKTQAVILFAGGLFIAGLLFAIFYKGNTPPVLPPVHLVVWGTDPKQYVEPLMGAYSAYRPNVTMEYRQMNPATYKTALWDSMAAGEGPDIFFVKNTWISKESKKLFPAPSTAITAAKLDSLFPGVVSEDLVRNGSVWALPLYLDTMALYWNKSIFDQAGIIGAPSNWTDVQKVSAILTKKDSATAQISRAGIALGTDGASVMNAPDIVQNLIEQNGAQIAEAQGEARFASESREALSAFNFYLNFANPISEYYSWNTGLGTSREAFSSGKAAMIIDYGSAMADIKSRNAFIPLRIGALPQAGENAVNTASYDALAVSKQSTSTPYAWEFITYTLTNPEISKLHLAASGRYPALLSLLGQITDQQGAIFARQALTAKAWQVPDDEGVKKAFNDAINSVFSGTDSQRALLQAQESINMLIRANVR